MIEDPLHLELIVAVVAIVGLLLNIGAIVWGLAKVSARIEQHDKVIEELTKAIKGLGEFDKRIAILEYATNPPKKAS